MIPSGFPGANRLLVAGEGTEDALELPMFTDGVLCVSCWIPTAEELAELVAGKPLYLYVNSGTTQPPVLLTTDPPILPAHLRGLTGKPS